MDFFKFIGDTAKNVGNFFNGVFGESEEEKRRKRREAAQARRQPTQRPTSSNYRTNTNPLLKAPELNQPQPNVKNNNQSTPSKTRDFLTLEQFVKKEPVKAPVVAPVVTDQDRREKSRQISSIIAGTKRDSNKNYLTKEEYDAAVKKREQMNRSINKKGVSAGDVAASVVEAPFKLVSDWIVKPIGEHVAEGIWKNTQRQEALSSLDEKAGKKSLYANKDYARTRRAAIDEAEKDGSIDKNRASKLRQELEDNIRSATNAVEQVKRESKEKYGTEIPTQSEAFWAAAIPTAEVATLGGYGAIKNAAMAAGQRVAPFMTRAAEKALGRGLSKEEAAALEAKAVDLEREIAEEGAKQGERLVDDAAGDTIQAGGSVKAGERPVETPPVKAQPQEKVSPELPTKEEVAESYKNVVNQVRNDSTLTPETKAQFEQEARDRHADLLKQIDDSATAQAQVVADQAKVQADQATQLQAEVKAVQEANEAAVTPPANAPQPATAPQVTDVTANDAAYRGVDEYVAEQTVKRDSLDENPAQKVFDTVRRELYDPQLVEQRYANAELKRLKAAGLIDKKATQLNPQDDLTYQTARMNNPGQAAMSRIQAAGVDKIIKKYGNDNGQKATQFNNYRLFKEELWLMSPEGGSNPSSLGIDPVEMARYIKEYEAKNPTAVQDAAILREFSLDNMRRRTEAGIDSVEHYQNSARNPYYTPRVTVRPEEAVRPGIFGMVSRSIKGTKARGDVSPTSESPLSAFVRDAADTEKGLATQARGEIAKRMADAGVDGFEVNVDAAQLVTQRENLKTMDDLRSALAEARQVRDTISGEKKVAGAELRKAEATIAKAEDRAVTLMQQLLQKAKGDSDQVLNDVVTRDPRYADELAAIKNQDFPTTLTAKERRDQINYDIAQLNKKYPNPKAPNRDQMLELARSLGDEFPKTGEQISTSQEVRNMVPGMEENIDALRGMFNQSREEIAQLKEQRAQTWQQIMDNAQMKETNVNEIPYRVDGEIGSIKIPTDLAREYAKQNDAFNQSLGDKLWGGLAGAIKTTWTGLLSPVFQTFQIAKNIPLAYRNAPGLSGVNLKALDGFVNDLFRTQRGQALRRELQQRGANFETATMGRTINRDTAADIAARANFGTFIARNPVKSMGDVTKFLNTGLAYVQNSQRAAVARSTYERAVKMGLDEETALQMAAQAPAKVFGDLNRVSNLARMLEPVLPYSGATQAGARAMARATKERPLESTFKDMTVIAGFGGLTAYSLSNSMEYHRDMIESGKEYELDANIPIVLPGASRNEKGEWTGVINVPLTPDFRPFNRATWRNMYAMMDDDPETGIDAAGIAAAIFNEFTGDQATNLYDPAMGKENPANGFLSGSPILNAGKVAVGVNPRTGDPLVDETLSSQPSENQVIEGYTSDAARNISAALGGTASPIQIDAFLSQLGNTGKSIKAMDDDEDTPTPFERFFNFGEPLDPGKGMSDKGKAYLPVAEDIEMVLSTLDPNDKVTIREFQAMHSKKTDAQKENMLNSATNANKYMAYNGDGSFTTTALFEAERKLNELAKARGQVGNPIFDLAPQELQKVLTYRAGKIYNAAKQNYTKNGEGAFQSLGLDNKWYKDFQDAEDAYYKSIFKDAGDDEYKTFSGATKPKLTASQEALQDEYFNLPEKSQERRDFLARNEWLKDYWAETNDFSNEERKALGFNQVEDEYEKNKNGWGWGNGSGGGSYVDDENVLNYILNLGSDPKRLEDLTENQKEIMLNLQKFMAPRRGGRANVTIGAKATGR